MQEALVLARPPGQAQQLMLLLHAAGTTAAAMAPLGAVLAREFPAAFIVGIEAPLAAEGGSGRTWYPAAGLTEENLPERAAAPATSPRTPSTLSLIHISEPTRPY